MISVKERIFDEFTKQFGDTLDTKLYFAPGRVNLIGEHTDYNGGYVLPFAIHYGTYILARSNDTATCRVYSMNFNDGITCINMIEPQKPANHWSDYLRGIIDEFSKIGITFATGIDAIIYGNIPNGSGLSSSASLELALILALTGSNGFDIPKNGTKEMIDYCILAQKVENNFIGVNCGIMDQFAIGNGKINNAILLNCNNLDFDYFPLKMAFEILIMNTKVSRRLKDSKYNERRAECEQGLAILQKMGLKANSLGDISMTDWTDRSDEVKKNNPTIWKRLSHVFEENARVLRCAYSLKCGELNDAFVEINSSHCSLREKFEVTGPYLDSIVLAAKCAKGVEAARMIGGGFGGCAMSIVESGRVNEVIPFIRERYMKETGIEPEFYNITSQVQNPDDIPYCSANDGAKMI